MIAGSDVHVMFDPMQHTVLSARDKTLCFTQNLFAFHIIHNNA